MRAYATAKIDNVEPLLKPPNAILFTALNMTEKSQ